MSCDYNQLMEANEETYLRAIARWAQSPEDLAVEMKQ
jgi:hypothetical protein